MYLIGVDYHPSFQTIAFFVEETGECGERELNHSEERSQCRALDGLVEVSAAASVELFEVGKRNAVQEPRCAILHRRSSVTSATIWVKITLKEHPGKRLVPSLDRFSL